MVYVQMDIRYPPQQLCQPARRRCVDWDLIVTLGSLGHSGVDAGPGSGTADNFRQQRGDENVNVPSEAQSKCFNLTRVKNSLANLLVISIESGTP
ncbi:hypothetical protein EVAR_29161_1 [Eumeta japonica]|uniref:Uncharacterized protein n=1 Tax=Eumeta variegata TaxID=151549 RepID=A0A4C1VB01_EUMVA|nr:hypothetical protein EVAR_29161_1 [Eumeta japonica]